MAIKMFRLFLGIAIRKFSQIFDFGWQIINWAACSMTPNFMNTCYLQVVGNSTSLSIFVLLLQFMAAQQHITTD